MATNDICIAVDGLGKSYRLGPRERYRTLRDSLVHWAQAPARYFRNRRSGPTDPGAILWALKDVSFEVRRGEVIGIIGRNGAGKSTLLKILSRITRPDEGCARVRGRVGSLLEVGTGFHPELTGRENIYLNGAMLGMRRREIDRKFDEIVAFAETEAFLDVPVKRYSSGMYMRLAFAVAAHLETEILFVDEVLSVGDLQFRQKCVNKVRAVGASGRTTLFVSHDMTAIRQLCTRAILLREGRVVQDGDVNMVTTRHERDGLAADGEPLASAIRGSPPAGYHLRKVEIRDTDGRPRSVFDAGDTLEIHLETSGPAPQDDFTVEFKLHNHYGEVVSFGAANPVRNTYFARHQRHLVCRLGPLPLTSGVYSLSFSVRVWGAARWDSWEDAIEIRIARCDLFHTGHDVPGGPNGAFVIQQEWFAEDAA